MSLTQRQIESFEQNGYLVMENFVSKQECEKLRVRNLTHSMHAISSSRKSMTVAMPTIISLSPSSSIYSTDGF